MVEFSCGHHGKSDSPIIYSLSACLYHCPTQFLLVYTSTHSAIQSLSPRLLCVCVCVCVVCAQNNVAQYCQGRHSIIHHMFISEKQETRLISHGGGGDHCSNSK